MAKRNRIIYASQAVFAEGRILYRVQTLGSSTTFNTTDVFELGQLELTDIVDDNPEVAVTLETRDYGSVYTMATLAKIPTNNLNHNIRQTDGVTFIGDVGGVDTSTGTVSGSVPAASGTGIANIRIKEEPTDSDALAYLHGVQLIDFGRECGVSKGLDIWSPVQAECSLGTADDDIEMTKYLADVFINSIELNYNSDAESDENYGGETEKKQWFLNDARFLSHEVWEVGVLANQVAAATMAAKTKLVMSLAGTGTVATLEDTNLGFLKKTATGLPAALLTFKGTGGLSQGESKLVPIFQAGQCIPSSVNEFFLYSSSSNELDYYMNGSASTLLSALPPGRSAYQTGDKITLLYVADEYAKEVGDAGRPGAADSTEVAARYFSPIAAEDVEDVGSIRQGQVEAYLVDPDLIFKTVLTNANIGATSVAFSGNVGSDVDLTKYVGLKLKVVDGAGKGSIAREITGATNNLQGNYNNGSLDLGGSDWPAIALTESTSAVSTTSGVYVEDLCAVDADYVGSDITCIVSSSPETTTIAAVDEDNKLITLSPALSGPPDDGSQVLVDGEPSTASEVLVGEYELALRLQNVRITADLTREPLKELGHLNPYARTLTLPIPFTVAVDTTAGDLETFATFAGAKGKFSEGTLTDVDIFNLFAKDNLAVVVMIYQQTDEEAGGNGLDRKVLSPDMFGDDYWVDGVRGIYTATDGSLTEYPLKSVVVQNLRITDEEYSLSLGDNATQTFAFRGTNQLSAVRGFISVDLATKVIESQSE